MRPSPASRTATFIALARALETTEPRRTPLFQDPYARRFLDGIFAIAAAAAARRVLRPLTLAAIDRRAPGARTSAVGRTRFIDDAVRDAVSNGATDVVILGAGFDCRAHRLPILRSQRVFEVDRAETQRKKRKQLGAAPGLADVIYVEVDFNVDAVLDRLMAAGLSPSHQSVFIWEGVTSYLNASAVANVLAMVATCAKGTRLIFTYIHRGAVDGTVPFEGAAKLRAEVARLGEPWTFGFLPCELPGILAAHGLRLLEDIGANDYRERYGASLGSSGYGFYRVAIAEVGVTAC